MRARRILRACSTSIAATSVALASLAAPHLVRAQPAHADAKSDADVQFDIGIRLLREAVRDHDRDKLEEACNALDASNRLEPKAGTLLQLGDCRERNQQLASAWAVYRDALVRAVDPNKRKLAADKVHALERRLSAITITVGASSRLDGLTITLDGVAIDPATWNHPRPSDGGTHVIAGHAPGHIDWQTQVDLAIESGKVRVDVPALSASPPEPVAPPVEPAVSVPSPVVVITPPAAAPPNASWLTRRREVALGVAGAGVVSVVVGAIVGASAEGKKNDAFAACDRKQPTCVQADRANALLDSAHHRALAANIAFGVAGVSAVAAGLLWFTGAPSAESSHRVSVAPSVAPNQTSLVVVGSF